MTVQSNKRYAYTTLITRKSYLAGVIILAHTLKQHGSRYPLIVLYTPNLEKDAVAALELEAAKSNIIPWQCEFLLPPEGVKTLLIAERFKDTWTKLRIFELFGYDAVCYLDADMAIFKNMDAVFEYETKLPADWLGANHACVCNLDKDSWAPEDWTAENCAYTPLRHPTALTDPLQPSDTTPRTYRLLNGGMLLFHPSEALWESMLHTFNTSPLLSTYQFPDQDFLADFFDRKWLAMGWQWNAIKTMRYWHPDLWRDDEVICLHYIVDKPWAKRVGSDGTAGYLGKDGVTHSWWWDAYARWEAERGQDGQPGKEILQILDTRMKIHDILTDLDCVLPDDAATLLDTTVCDGKVPCNKCIKASAECVDGDSVRVGNRPRLEIERLRQRVQWLETVIKDHCPDVNLSKQPPLDFPTDDDYSLPVDITTDTITREDAVAQIADATSVPLATEGRRRGATAEESAHDEQQPQQQVGSGLRSHEIGLIALSGSQDPRYIGPSSGHFLARVMLASNRREQDTFRARPPEGVPAPCVDLIEALEGPLPVPPQAQALQLCNQYFEVLNAQYPILHRPSFMHQLQLVISNEHPESGDAFQVFMVLALGATVISHRRRCRLPAESYCLSALRHLDQLNVENSLQGLQCLLLLFLFTIHCPNVKLNVWYLNYQCLAAVLDLGLQRHVTTKHNISLLEQEMRTRIFWVAMMLDRRAATMMGRPIGLRDEACELRLPLNISDEALGAPSTVTTLDSTEDFSFAIHLFKLTRLNSEFKYVANSIVRDVPVYAYPAIIDINQWQRDMLTRLDEWFVALPNRSSQNTYLHTVCEMHYQNLRMALLRPSPAILNPSNDALKTCYEAATRSLVLISETYRSNLLLYSWETLYSLVLSAITRLYTIKRVPDITRSTDPETLLLDMGNWSSMLSAIGEHWSSARRARDTVEEIGRGVVRWLKEANKTQTGNTGGEGELPSPMSRVTTSATRPRPSDRVDFWEAGSPPATGTLLTDTGTHLFAPIEDTSTHDLGLESGDLFSLPGWTDGQMDFDCDNMDAMIRSLFDDFIPIGNDLAL
ncbi:hypothetical protein S40293_04999 [Stachybotrys chartarum IBT 40293]|nr:hypothetical protein S40293_04999 [Stachybotrys chartarum IBT 40293]